MLDRVPDRAKTKVIFRKWKRGGDIVALFPGIPYSQDPFNVDSIMSYMTIGQHGEAHYTYMMEFRTVRATPDEYKALQEELESIGYNLEVVKKR